MPPRRHFLSRLALALMLTVGAGIVWGFLFSWINLLVRQIVYEPYEYWNLTVSTTGTPYQVRYTTGSAVYRTLRGKHLPPEKAAEINSLQSAGLLAPRGLEGPAFHLGWDARIVLFTDPGPPEVLWYFVHNGEREAGAGYFIGYHAESKRRIGYLARQGLRTETPPVAEWFPIDGRRMQDHSALPTLMQYRYQSGIWQEYNRAGDGTFPAYVTHMVADGKLWEIDFRGRTAKVVFEAKDLLSFGRLERAVPMPSDGKQRYIPRPDQHLAVRLPDRVVILDPPSDDRREYRIPESLRHETFTFYELQNGKAIVTFYPKYDPDAKTRLRLMVLTQQGAILSEAMIPQQPTRWYDQPATIASINAVEIPEPIVGIFTTPMPYVERAIWKGERSPVRAWVRGLGSAWPQVLLVFLASAAMAAWVRGRQKRLGQPHALLWAIFVFLGGLPGLAGYLVHRSWPVVEPCPNCREPAPRDREACMHCGEAFPPPAPQGIEVFAA